MVLLDRSTLRLKAATAKLKKQAHCNMSLPKRTNADFSHKNAEKAQEIRFCAFCASLRRFRCTIAANVKSKNRDSRRRLRGAFYCSGNRFSRGCNPCQRRRPLPVYAHALRVSEWRGGTMAHRAEVQ